MPEPTLPSDSGALDGSVGAGLDRGLAEADGQVADFPTGNWRLREVWLDIEDARFSGHGPQWCAVVGLDQVLVGLTVRRSGAFEGWPITDYEERWAGTLVEDGAGWQFKVEACDVDCLDADRFPSHLGSAARVGDQLVVRRVGLAFRRADDQCGACVLCGQELHQHEDVEVESVYERVSEPGPYAVP